MANFNEALRWTDSNPAIYVTVSYSKRRSGVNMIYNVSLSISTVTGSSTFGFPIYADIYINNSSSASFQPTLKNASPSQWSSPITYSTGEFTVSNKITGTTHLMLDLSSGSGSTRWQRWEFDMAVDTVTTPTLSNPSISNITTNSASSSFSVTNDGGLSITSKKQEISLTNFGTVLQTINNTSGSFTNLSPNTTYYVRAQASNGVYTGYSGVVDFMTSASPPTNLSITNVTSSYSSNIVSISGKIQATSSVAITNYTIYYKESTQNNYISLNQGTSTNFTISNLETDTSYNIYFTATSSSGTSTSSVVTTRTVSIPFVYTSINGGQLTSNRLKYSVNGQEFKEAKREKVHIDTNI